MINFENRLLNTPLKDIFLKTKMFDELLPFDEYHLVMAQTDVLLNIHNKKAVKSYFYRTAPFGSSYIITYKSLPLIKSNSLLIQVHILLLLVLRHFYQKWKIFRINR